jgi:ribonuclease BN (tRNA processing enzyme)
VDVLIHNSAWIERLEPPESGHCAKVQSVMDFAVACGAGKLVLTHHSPYSTDAHLDGLQQRLNQKGGLPVVVAHEGLVLELGA